jgi:hypothetical protein
VGQCRFFDAGPFAYDSKQKGCFFLRFISPYEINGLEMQNAAFWPAKPMVLARNMHGFATQNACFQIVRRWVLQDDWFLLAKR